MVDAAKELELIRREGFEQREGKKTRYSGDFGGAPPRSRGYLGEVITLSPADSFMLLYLRQRLVTLGIVLRAQCILHRVHLLGLWFGEGILVSQGPLISLRLVGAILSVVIWDTL